MWQGWRNKIGSWWRNKIGKLYRLEEGTSEKDLADELTVVMTWCCAVRKQQGRV